MHVNIVSLYIVWLENFEIKTFKMQIRKWKEHNYILPSNPASAKCWIFNCKVYDKFKFQY